MPPRHRVIVSMQSKRYKCNFSPQDMSWESWHSMFCVFALSSSKLQAESQKKTRKANIKKIIDWSRSVLKITIFSISSNSYYSSSEVDQRLEHTVGWIFTSEWIIVSSSSWVSWNVTMLRGWVGAVIQTGVSSKQAHPCTKQHLRRQNSPIIVGNTRDGRLRAILCVLEREKKIKVTWNDFFLQLCWILAQSLGVGQEHECNAVPSLSWILKTPPAYVIRTLLNTKYW